MQTVIQLEAKCTCHGLTLHHPISSGAIWRQQTEELHAASKAVCRSRHVPNASELFESTQNTPNKWYTANEIDTYLNPPPPFLDTFIQASVEMDI
jgi:hypothetical protein